MKYLICVCTYLHSTVGLEGGSISSCNLNVIFCPLAHGGLYASFGALKKQIDIIYTYVLKLDLYTYLFLKYS